MSTTDRTYLVAVTFTVDENTDEFLQSEQAITEEFESWLESLRATVHNVTVRSVEEGDTQ